MDILYLLIQNAYPTMTVLLIVALGGLLTERSGVTNIALEGIMIFGAFLGVWAIHGLEIYPFTVMTIIVMILVSLVWIISIALLIHFGLSKLGLKEFSLKRLNFKNPENKGYIAINIIFVIIFTGLIVLSFFVFGIPKQLILIMGIMIGGMVGALYAMIHAYASIHMKADQVISATALNLFAPAFAIFTARFIQRGQQIPFSSSFMIQKVPLLGDIPVIGDLFFSRVFISFYIALALLVILWIIVYKSKFGLRFRACGENPHAADSLGINIYKMRFISVMISGAFAGMGGAIFTANTLTEYAPTMVGLGFLAIAVLIFGNWKPSFVFLAAMFFAFLRVLGQYYNNIPFLSNIGIPEAFYRMTPYIATLVVLSFLSKSSRAPKALGQIYDKGQR